MYKYEIHLHTSECSRCAVSSAHEMILHAKEKGYNGVVITDHFYHGNTCVNRKLPWDKFVDAYELNFLNAKAIGDEIGIDVILGFEEIYNSDMKEVLIYGITPAELKAETDFINYNLEQIFEFVERCGGFLSHAHPFRNRAYIKNTDMEPNHKALHGVEVFNVTDSDDRNKMALEFAEKYGLKQLSGGDIHTADNRLGTSGIAVEKPIHDTKQLAKVLHSGNYKLIINGQIK